MHPKLYFYGRENNIAYCKKRIQEWLGEKSLKQTLSEKSIKEVQFGFG